MKRKLDQETKQNKRKKLKIAKTEKIKDKVKAELLEVQNLREGLVLLGCIIEIRPNSLQISLPGCLVGVVSISHISKKFTEILKESVENDSAMPKLESLFSVGSVLPCKVLQVLQKEKMKKATVVLTIDPADVNSDLRSSSIYKKMVLHAAVSSIEDHGYVMDVGIKDVQGFLPFGNSIDTKTLQPGQIIPTCVKKLPSANSSGNVVWLKELTFNDIYPQVEEENMKLSSILPGANVSACITKIKQPFMYLDCMNFQACVNSMSIDITKNLTEDSQVSCTVLYIHPITHMIYLLLSDKPTPNTFHNFFRVKKFDLIQNIKYHYGFHSKVVFAIGKRNFGYLMKAQLPKKGELSQEALASNPAFGRARIVFLHYMDKLAQLSIKRKFLDMDFKKLEDMHVGDMCEGLVKEHSPSGMFVSICPGLTGYVRNIFLSDSLVTQPEKLYPKGSQVQCRVLSLNPLLLTCKRSLLQLASKDILQSFLDAERNQWYKGVIVQKADTHILVLFFNDVKGIVFNYFIPESSLLFVGQTVSCQVVFCDPKNERLKLSMLKSSPKGISIAEEKKNSHQLKQSKVLLEPSKSDDIWKQNLISLPLNENSLTEVNAQLEFNPEKSENAVIKKITGRQLNILINESIKGRVHISEIGTFKEDEQPLKLYSHEQQIRVHILGSYSCRSHNYLQISHRSTKTFMECSLIYPPPVVLDYSFKVGQKVMAYIKEVASTCVILWLSPSKTGTLEYLHFAKNPKILRNLKKHLKVRHSMEVTVLKIKTSRKNNDSAKEIMLTKSDIDIPKSGQNIVGLVQFVSPEKGIVLKLPHGYHGVVAPTDIKDVYSPIGPLLTKYQHLSFILCHILEVDHDTQYCQLSLRKSRLYETCSSQNIYPEITVENLENGKTVKAIVKDATENYIVSSIGRNLDGEIVLHKCDSPGCANCKRANKILLTCSPGSVIEVVIDGIAKNNVVPLTLPEMCGLRTSSCNRLSVSEDINWYEV